MTDKELRQSVLDEIEYDPSFDAAHIGVSAEKGVITLTGHVSSYPEKVSAMAAVRRVKGVRAIADEIEVRYAFGKKTSDDQIAKRALDLLSWDSMIPSERIQVAVRDGWITLTGTVDWFYQKRSAEGSVRKLAGLIGVTNGIEIKPKVKTEDVKGKIEKALARRAETEAKNIKVTVNNNDEVVLEGRVGNWEERYAVENAAWSAPGVKSVDDRLAIV